MTAITSGKRARTRALLLVALQQLLLDPRESSVSVPRLVARAGVAQGTFYNHFSSLSAAIEAVGKLLLAEHFRTVLKVIAGATDAAEVTARTHRQTLMLFAQRPDVGHLVFDSGEPIDRLIFMQDARPHFLANLQWGVDDGVFTVDNPQATTSVHTGAVIGCCLDIHRGSLSAGDAAEVVLRLLLDLGVDERRSRQLVSAPQEFEPWRPLPLIPREVK